MTARQSKQFEPRVQSILTKLNISGPPVPVEKVAKHFRAEIRLEPADADLSGALLRQGKTAVIGVNSHHPSVRQRFTIAHEIGHLIFHSELGREVHMDDGRSTGIVETPSRDVQVLFRDETSSKALEPKEIEANRFAAVLLMPSKFLREALENVSIPVSESVIRELAKKFKVSPQAMQYRLLNLGVPLSG